MADTVNTFGFSNAGQIGNDLKLGGALYGLYSSFSGANTIAESGAANKAIMYARAATADRNAKYVAWKGKYESNRILHEAKINASLADATYAEQMRAADVTLQSANRTLSMSAAKAKEFGIEASAVWTDATTRSIRAFQNSRQMLGEQTASVGRSGFAMEGSELDRLVETANRLEIARMDELRASAEQARQLRFAGKLAAFEGEEAAFGMGEEYRAQTFSAAVSMYKSEVMQWNAVQEAQVALQEAKQQEKNLKAQARDLRMQGDLMEREAQARAESEKKGGFMKAVLTVADIITP